MEMKMEGLNYSNNPLISEELNTERFPRLGYQIVAVVQVRKVIWFQAGGGQSNPNSTNK